MKPIAVLCLLAALSAAACAAHRQPAPSVKDSLPDTGSAASAANPFFPVADFLEAEILKVDSTPLALKKWVIRNHRRDSSFITVPEFNALALQFLPPEIRDNNLQKNFTESAFGDKTTQLMTFTYSPIDKDLPLQRVDVLTGAGARAQQVKSIYLEENHRVGDSVIFQKLFWEAGRSFQIVTMARKGNGPLTEDQVQVIWGDEAEDQ